MGNEIRKRKKRFLALCLVFMLVLLQSAPIVSLAAEYTLEYKNVDGSGYKQTFSTDVVQPGDKLTFKPNPYYNVTDDGNTLAEIVYKDYDGTILRSTFIDSTHASDASITIEVLEYDNTTDDNYIARFKGWEIKSINGSGDALYSSNSLVLQAVAYDEKNITYSLGTGETNDPANPSKYFAGKENIELKPATKDNYDFVGWYTDEACSDSNKIDTITTGMNQDLTLYAKFTPKEYNIVYYLPSGATVPDEKITKYTYSVGVSADNLPKATKTGYTFNGWYSDNTYTTQKTEISPTDSEDLILYAKFTVNTYNINYVFEDVEISNPNPLQFTYGEGVASLADASKTGYTFKGWFAEPTYSTQVTAISGTVATDVTLYGKFEASVYTIGYTLNGGTNGAGNPTSYTYGVGVASFADASKVGHTFDGWYSDGTFTTAVEKITSTDIGNVVLYAKFTADTYGISYVLDGGANGAGNPTSYTYGVGVASLADASKTGYTFDGWYSDSTFTTKVTSITTTKIGDVTLYAKFTKIKLTGTGSVTVADVNYGITPMPVYASATNGNDKVTIEYKSKNAADTTYTTTKPTKAGEYTVRATFAETEEYYKIVATSDFSIDYLAAPEVPYELSGETGEDSYYTSDVTITAPAGYLISDTLDGTYAEKLTISESTEGMLVYLIKTSTGEKTSGIMVSQIKIDGSAPEIANPSGGNTIYGDMAEITISDDNLKEILVNGKAVDFQNGKAILKLTSNNGEEKYEIVCVDYAGNKSEVKVVVSANWMKTRIIPLNEKVKLFKEYSYKLGDGQWKVSGDNTTYAGGTSFYVSGDGEYTFSKTN